MNRKSAKQRLLSYLKTGRDITTEQAAQRFGITNVSARVSELRGAGYAIYCNEKTTANGNTIRAYRLGSPTRAQIAAGHFAKNDWYVADRVSQSLR